mgnify:CR=1 FL=1
MSKEQKSGEDLIEKVEQDVAETTQETKQETSEFDPKAFAGGEETKVETPAEEAEETVETEEQEVPEEENDFSWDKVELDKEPEEEQEEDEDWDIQPKAETKEVQKEDVKESVYDWQTLGAEFGVEAEDEKSFKEAIRNAIEEPTPVTDTIQNLQGFLKMDDAQLVASDLEAAGLEKDEIKDTVNRMHDSGLLKKEAFTIRKNLQNYIATERKKAKKQKEQEEKQLRDNNLNNRKALQGYIKEKSDFFGGKVGRKEKKELYDYITSGGFSEEIYSSHANVADAAFLWKYKEKIFKMLAGQGLEKGKASVINKITNPNLGRKSQHIDTKTKGGFDPVEFMK